MIKVKVTKNIIRKGNNSLGLSTKQMVIAAIAAMLGVAMYFIFRNMMNLEVLFTLIFIVVAGIIMFGCVNIQGMSLFEYFLKMFKGVDVRPYKTEGVFADVRQKQKK